MRRQVIVVTSFAVAAVIVIGAFLLGERDGPTGTRFPTRATATYPDGSSAVTFNNIGEMVATADFLVEAEVLDVERGDPVTYADGSGTTIVPRVLVVQVRDTLHSRGPRSTAPETLRVIDGYWEDGVGFERESVGWAMPGQIGYFLLSRDRAPDGTLMTTYSPLDGNGIALIKGNHVRYTPRGVWQALGEAATIAEFRRALDQGISAARSGAAKPVLVTICYPSVPGDEQSEPVCVEE